MALVAIEPKLKALRVLLLISIGAVVGRRFAVYLRRLLLKHWLIKRGIVPLAASRPT